MDAVTVRLMGGLGNQMFQYAAGHALASHLGAPLLLDRTYVDARPPDMTWTPRPFALDAFQAPLAFASEQAVTWARNVLDDKRHRLLRNLFPARGKQRFYQERSYIFDPAFFQLRAPIYLEGYWQCERYFLAVADELRSRLFVPKDAPSPQNGDLAGRITTGITASVHVRRGDYVSLREAAEFHGVLPLEHYRSSAAWLAEHHGVDHFFVFSDEPERVRTELRLEQPFTVVMHNTGNAAHWDLWLMRQARHHIIANSSFSWWGAWLNGAPGQVVIAPKRWFAGMSGPTDILPPTWIAR